MTTGATIFGCSGTTLTADEKILFADADPFGFILFARNIDTPDQVRQLTGELRDTIGRDVPILVDQEGGRVQRLRAPYWREWMPPLDQVERMGPDLAARGLYLRYRLIGAELRGVGIDTNCAPVGDVAAPETHPFLRNRCYSDDPRTVALLARSAAEGLLDAGVLPILKHIPGHGRSIADSHLDLPRVTVDRDLLDASDFLPFRELSDLPMAMTAHIVYTDLDAELPGTLSPEVIRVIRDDIGFDGLLMTDDLSMGALSGTMTEKTTAALAAGCDVVLHCNGELAEMIEVADAAGRLNADAARRGDAALALRRAADAETADLAAEFADLISGRSAHA